MVVKYIQTVGNDGSYILHKEFDTSLSGNSQPNLNTGDSISFDGKYCLKVVHKEYQYVNYTRYCYIFVVPEKLWFDRKKMRKINS